MVSYKCIPVPQMSMSEVLERYAPSPSFVLEGTATTASSRRVRQHIIHFQKIWLDS